MEVEEVECSLEECQSCLERLHHDQAHLEVEVVQHQVVPLDRMVLRALYLEPPLQEGHHALPHALVPLPQGVPLLMALPIPLQEFQGGLPTPLLHILLYRLALPLVHLYQLQVEVVQHQHHFTLMEMIDGPSTQIMNYPLPHHSRTPPRSIQVEDNQDQQDQWW